MPICTRGAFEGKAGGAIEKFRGEVMLRYKKLIKVIKSYPRLIAFNCNYLRILLFPYFTKLLNSEAFA